MNSSPTSQSYSNYTDYESKRHLLEEIKQLSKEEHKEIFRIIKRNNVEYTENSNGVFFDLSICTTDVFTKLVDFLELCKTQRKDEEVRTNEMESLRHETNNT